MERAEAKVFAKREHYKKLFNRATSPKSLAQVIHAFPEIIGTHSVCVKVHIEQKCIEVLQ
jgi:hypothetical protein